MLFNKKQDELKKELKKLQENNETLQNNLSKLLRIVKYSGSEPTYHLANRAEFDVFFSPIIKHTLYIYVDKEEYSVELEELDYKHIDEKKCEFRIEGEFAYFNVYFTYLNYTEKHEFIIDFNNGKYVHSVYASTDQMPNKIYKKEV